LGLPFFEVVSIGSNGREMFALTNGHGKYGKDIYARRALAWGGVRRFRW